MAVWGRKGHFLLITNLFNFLQIYIYVFKNINMIQISALLLSLLSLTVLILTKELNEKYKSQIKFIIPIDIILVSANCFIVPSQIKNM